MISRNCFRKTFFFRLFDLLVFTGKTHSQIKFFLKALLFLLIKALTKSLNMAV